MRQYGSEEVPKATLAMFLRSLPEQSGLLSWGHNYGGLTQGKAESQVAWMDYVSEEIKSIYTGVGNSLHADPWNALQVTALLDTVSFQSVSSTWSSSRPDPLVSSSRPIGPISVTNI